MTPSPTGPASARRRTGSSKPEIGAPGAHIVSTLARHSAFEDLCPACVVDGDYIRVGGSSMAAPVVAGVAALMFEAHPEWTPDEAKSTLIETARNVAGGVDEVNSLAAVSTETPYSGVNAGIVPNDLVDSTAGEIDYTRSSWGRSSWGAAPETLAADWARSSWGCTCGTLGDDRDRRHPLQLGERHVGSRGERPETRPIAPAVAPPGAGLCCAGTPRSIAS